MQIWQQHRADTGPNLPLICGQDAKLNPEMATAVEGSFAQA